MFSAAVIQFINNKLLIVGFASMIGVLVIFIMLENPMANIDRDTGFFNLNAFFEYMKEAYGQGKDVSIVCVRYGSNGNEVFSSKMENSIFTVRFFADLRCFLIKLVCNRILCGKMLQ